MPILLITLILLRLAEDSPRPVPLEHLGGFDAQVTAGGIGDRQEPAIPGDLLGPQRLGKRPLARRPPSRWANRQPVPACDPEPGLGGHRDRRPRTSVPGRYRQQHRPPSDPRDLSTRRTRSHFPPGPGSADSRDSERVLCPASIEPFRRGGPGLRQRDSRPGDQVSRRPRGGTVRSARGCAVARSWTSRPGSDCSASDRPTVQIHGARDRRLAKRGPNAPGSVLDGRDAHLSSRAESAPWQLLAEIRYDPIPVEGIAWDGGDLILAAEEGRGLYRLSESIWRASAQRDLGHSAGTKKAK